MSWLALLGVGGRILQGRGSHVAASCLVLLLGFAVVMDCHAQPSAPLPRALAEAPYPAWTTYQTINRSGGYDTAINWLDDNTLFFPGYTQRGESACCVKAPENPNLPRGYQPGLINVHTYKQELFVWRLGEEAKRYGVTISSDGHFRVCAWNGIVAYAADTLEGLLADKPYYREMRGPIGHERETVIPKLPPREPGPPYNALPSNQFGNSDPVGCELKKSDPKMQDRAWFIDVSKQFYLDFGFTRNSAGKFIGEGRHKISLMHSDGSSRIELPIELTPSNALCSQTHEFASYMLVWDCVRQFNAADIKDWRDGGCRDAWRIWLPDARVEKFCTPSGPWVGASVVLVPTKAGIFFASYQSQGDSGFYRIEGAKADKIFDGVLDAIQVSPNGCRVSFLYGPTLASYGLRTIGTIAEPLVPMVINVCTIRSTK